MLVKFNSSMTERKIHESKGKAKVYLLYGGEEWKKMWKPARSHPDPLLKPPSSLQIPFSHGSRNISKRGPLSGGLSLSLFYLDLSLTGRTMLGNRNIECAVFCCGFEYIFRPFSSKPP